MDTGKMINQISNRLRRRSQLVQKRIGISGAQGMVLDYILVASEKHPVYQKEIEKEFGMRPSTATELLREMERKELISRIPEEYDGRYKRIVFREKASDIREVLRAEIVGSEKQLLKGITREEQELFLQIAAKMLRNLDEQDSG